MLVGCAPSEPPNWAAGGAPLVIAPADWQRGDEDAIQIAADGKVYEDGDFFMLIDRAGRVVDEDYEPMAILLDNGLVVGPDSLPLGRVGWNNASPPGAQYAWFSILPDGNVVQFDSDGDRTSGGMWRGCNGPQQRVCTLVTQLVAMRSYGRHRRGSGVGVGIGMGVGVGY